jgi:hypothetical protein
MNPQMKSLQEVRELAGAELSVKARLGYVALLLVSAGMTAVIASLWSTEPALPTRTEVAFGAMCLIGVSWAGLAVWVLRARRPLFARDRVVAGAMAVTFTSVFVLGAITAVIFAGNATSLALLATGVAMQLVAIKIYAAARRRFAALATRRNALQGQQMS